MLIFNMEHPLKTYYPYGGQHYLLKHRSHNGGCGIILARSERAIDCVVRKLLIGSRDDYDYQIKLEEFLNIDIVAPPIELCKIAQEKFLLQEAENFLQSVTFYFSSQSKIPSMFEWCDNFENSTGEEIKYDFELDKHYDCVNCKNKLILKGYSLMEFYLKYHDAWKNRDPDGGGGGVLHGKIKSKYIDKSPVAQYSQAVLANSDMELMVASDANFGSHGISLDPISKFYWDNEFELTHPVLFFYHINAKLDLQPYVAFQNDLKTNREQIKKQNMAMAAKSKQTRQDDFLAASLRVFDN